MNMLIALLVLVLLICIAYWVVTKLTAAFQVADPLATVILVAVMLILIGIFLTQTGLLSGGSGCLTGGHLRLGG